MVTPAAGDFNFHSEYENIIGIVTNVFLGTSCDGGKAITMLIEDVGFPQINPSSTSVVNELLACSLHFLFRSVEFFN
ncbi:hypothetical protein D3C79_914120 [compost metagenome]